MERACELETALYLPEHGMIWRAGSNFLLSLPHSLCCGRREGRVAAPSGNPEDTTDTIVTEDYPWAHCVSISHGTDQNRLLLLITQTFTA